LIRWCLFVYVVFVVGCSIKNDKQKTIDEYYDINGLIDEQVELLDSISPTLLKNATIDHQQDLKKIIPHDSTWKAELSIFRTLDLNKPTLVDSYKRIQNSEKQISLISKFPDETSVDTLIVDLSENQNPTRIYASISNQNTLFKSAKKLEMLFVEKSGTYLLHQYKIEGWQKMMSKDSTSYLINSQLIY